MTQRCAARPWTGLGRPSECLRDGPNHREMLRKASACAAAPPVPWHRSGTAPPTGTSYSALEYGPVARPQRHEERLILSSTQGRRPGRSPRAARSQEAVDRQTLMLRRSVGLGAAVVVVILLVIGHQRLPGQPQGPRIPGLRLGRARARAVARARSRDRLFNLLSEPSRADALDVQTQVNAQRADAEQLVERARGTDHPDELNGANGWLVEALEFRADAIERIAAQLPGGARRRAGQPATRSTRSPARCRHCWPAT